MERRNAAAVQPNKGGSGLGIPVSPAVWMPVTNTPVETRSHQLTESGSRLFPYRLDGSRLRSKKPARRGWETLWQCLSAPRYPSGWGRRLANRSRVPLRKATARERLIESGLGRSPHTERRAGDGRRAVGVAAPSTGPVLSTFLSEPLEPTIRTSTGVGIPGVAPA